MTFMLVYLFIYSIFFRQGSPFSFATVLPRGPAHMNTNNNVKMQIKNIQYDTNNIQNNEYTITLN